MFQTVPDHGCFQRSFAETKWLCHDSISCRSRSCRGAEGSDPVRALPRCSCRLLRPPGAFLLPVDMPFLDLSLSEFFRLKKYCARCRTK